MTRDPDFIVVGAQRAGTTALAAALDTHPDIAMSTPKEPSFFARDLGGPHFRGPGDQWFAAQNITDEQEYFALFDRPAKAVGEASAMYLALPGCAQTIASKLPHVRIVIVVRDPLERARSAHSYLVTRAREREASFEMALAREDARRRDRWGPMWWLRHASDYGPAIEEFDAAFGRHRIHVLSTEELNQEPDGALKRLQAFLNVAYSPEPTALLSHERVNAGGAPRSRLLTRLLYPPDGARSRLRALAPRQAIETVRRMRNASTREIGSDPVPASIATEFAEMARRTHDVLGDRADLRRWWPVLGDQE